MPVGLALAALLLVILAPSIIKGQNNTNGTDEWTYPESTHPGELEWKDLYPKCGGSKQSPIDIEDVVPAKYYQLKMKGIKRNLSPANLTNNGHTVVLTVNQYIAVSGGPMRSDVYRFIQLHFHWGSEDNFGSEHQLKGQSYAMEMHLVFYKLEYRDLTSSLDHPDGIVVLAVWFKEVDSDNPDLSPVTDVVNQTINENNVTVVKKPLSVKNLLPKNTDSYYHYNGSLTTPGCDEVVKWIVFKEPASIGKKQLHTFRKLKEGEVHVMEMLSNHRPLQALNGRTVELVESMPGNGWLSRVSTPLILLTTWMAFILH